MNQNSGGGGAQNHTPKFRHGIKDFNYGTVNLTKTRQPDKLNSLYEQEAKMASGRNTTLPDNREAVDHFIRKKIDQTFITRHTITN